MKTFLVVNPRSASGETGKRWAEISGQVTRSIGDFGFGFTERAMDAVRMTRDALQAGYDCVVAVGGDGTVNEVVNGFFAEGKAINPQAALGLIPRGTGGDFRRAFGWELDLESALARLSSDKTEPFDVGHAEYVNHQGQTESRYFANIASFGVSATIAHEVNAGSKAFGGNLSFLWGTVKTLAKYKDRQVRLRVDGGAPETLGITVVAASNGRYFGSGMCVAPRALTDDGRFDLTLWQDYRLSDFIIKSKGVYNGDHTTWNKTRYLQCNTLDAESDDEVFLEMDGEVPGKLPCRIRLLPGAIRLKV
ncbi:diacylglycerol/lipid kinase family protein [Archangium primigenium]|uniref:diacylglycerol/lipid kinase family protein n=1 Tax=[Archangium] primigenium TaxID=2792470 RepID=UPI001957BDE7|nr:diacylglycerol kinase family protein [Archangium primigenium]MBM7115544.1 diacylglycerol kinase family lipid kinase [Archangium primigenium]